MNYRSAPKLVEFCLSFVLLGLTACENSTKPESQPGATISERRLEFSEATAEVGLVFFHDSGASGEWYFAEIMSGGVGLIDYDADGDLDVVFPQGRLLDPRQEDSARVIPMQGPPGPGTWLFRNQLAQAGKLGFENVSKGSGLDFDGYGMGVAVGDIDNDGFPDLYITALGSNALYRNNGDGSFQDITKTSGTDYPYWSTSATFLDYDNDGDLDLYVVNYVNFSVANHKPCKGPLGDRDYCNPSSYQDLGDRLFRNDGDNHFTDVTAVAGIDAATGAGLGVVCADFNSDGWADIYVANDGDANQLWINQGDGSFRDRALVAGAAYNHAGAAEAGMGVSAADYDNDGDQDLFVTHLDEETNTLYQNDGNAFFEDLTFRAGLGTSSLGNTGFGTEFFDGDNDGLLDIFIANGAVRAQQLPDNDDPYPYRQPNQLYVNTGGGAFADISGQSAAVSGHDEVSRGAAFGDIDNDGDIDIVIANNSGPARLLLNSGNKASHWISLRMTGVQVNRDAIGTVVGLVRDGRPTLWRRVHRDGSYLSANDARLHFGLGDQPVIDEVLVRWPGGRWERWTGLEGSRLHVLVEGDGQPRELLGQ